MNSNHPTYGCDICKYKCTKPSNLKLHLATRKHLGALSRAPSAPDRGTKKGVRGLSVDGLPSKDNVLQQKNSETETNIHSTLETLSGVVLQMVKQNAELQRLLVETQHQTQKQYTEILETQRNVQNTTIHNTTNNNTFNLQFFLNVKCKDAINMSDFIHSLDIQKEDIERLGRIGFAEGITRIFMDGLNGLETHKRPIHCTDIKRDTMYIKDDDQWAKDSQNARLLRAIEAVEQTNCRIFCKSAPPDMRDEKALIQYMTVLQEVNGGSAREKNRTKIVKNLSKACFLDRSFVM